MSRRHRSAALVAMLCLSLLPASASASTMTLGSALVHRWLALVKDRDAARLRVFMSPAFQIQRADGTRAGRQAYLAALPTVRSYRVRGLEATRNGDIVVATYEVASNQVINGKPFKGGFAPRISTFQRTPGGWQITSHANFNTPQ